MVVAYVQLLQMLFRLHVSAFWTVFCHAISSKTVHATDKIDAIHFRSLSLWSYQGRESFAREDSHLTLDNSANKKSLKDRNCIFHMKTEWIEWTFQSNRFNRWKYPQKTTQIKRLNVPNSQTIQFPKQFQWNLPRNSPTTSIFRTPSETNFKRATECL